MRLTTALRGMLDDFGDVERMLDEMDEAGIEGEIEEIEIGTAVVRLNGVRLIVRVSGLEGAYMVYSFDDEYISRYDTAQEFLRNLNVLTALCDVGVPELAWLNNGPEVSN